MRGKGRFPVFIEVIEIIEAIETIEAIEIYRKAIFLIVRAIAWTFRRVLR